MTHVLKFNIQPFGEAGAVAAFDDIDDAVALSLHMNKIADHLRARRVADDCIAGIASVTLRGDPATQSLAAIIDMLQSACSAVAFEPLSEPAQTLEFPVCYGGEHGPDLQPLCKSLALSEPAFIAAHSKILFRVLMIGFAPGFAYLGELPSALRAPRKATPAKCVAPGSIGVANNMTGIYPARSPGGWRLIGRTPEKLFDAKADQPFRIAAGDAVRFAPVSATEFERLCA